MCMQHFEQVYKNGQRVHGVLGHKKIKDFEEPISSSCSAQGNLTTTKNRKNYFYKNTTYGLILGLRE